jgi:hypothetical protein
MESGRRRVLILGAARGDFTTSTLISGIASSTRSWVSPRPRSPVSALPAELAGPLYPQGIPVHPETELEELIRALAVDQVVLAYSDLEHETVMSLASRLFPREPDSCPASFTRAELAAMTRGPMRVEIDEEGRTRVKERYLVSVPLAGRIQRTGLDAGRVRRVDPSG